MEEPKKRSHTWIEFGNFFCCEFCGIVRNPKNINKHCIGKVNITFREEKIREKTFLGNKR